MKVISNLILFAFSTFVLLPIVLIFQNEVIIHVGAYSKTVSFRSMSIENYLLIFCFFCIGIFAILSLIKTKKKIFKKIGRIGVIIILGFLLTLQWVYSKNDVISIIQNLINSAISVAIIILLIYTGLKQNIFGYYTSGSSSGTGTE